MSKLEHISESLTALWDSAVVSVNKKTLTASVQEASQNLSVRQTLRDHLDQFLFWLGISTSAILLVFLVSVTQKLEEVLDPALLRIKRFAPYIMQITLGIALLASSYYQALLGPGLPLETVFGSYAGFVQIMIYTAGLMLLLGIFPRVISFAVILFVIPFSITHTAHILTHATYIGEALTIFLFGGAYHSIKHARRAASGVTAEIRTHLHKYKFLILRLFFAVSLIASTVYTRLLDISHMNEIISNSAIMALFPDASFFVVGVIIFEVLLGVFFALGFEVRFASLAYIAFVGFLILFLQEVLWSQVVLIGTSLAMLTHGYDKYTIGGRWLSRGNLEPIL